MANGHYWNVASNIHFFKSHHGMWSGYHWAKMVQKRQFIQNIKDKMNIHKQCLCYIIYDGMNKYYLKNTTEVIIITYKYLQNLVLIHFRLIKLLRLVQQFVYKNRRCLSEILITQIRFWFACVFLVWIRLKQKYTKVD